MVIRMVEMVKMAYTGYQDFGKKLVKIYESQAQMEHKLQRWVKTNNFRNLEKLNLMIITESRIEGR